MNPFLYGLAFLLMLAWLAGFLLYSWGSFIHIVLLPAFDMVLLNLLKRRPAAQAQ